MRWLLFVTGWVATGLGALGIVLPLLPTTPFLLVAVGCFGRSSTRAQRWLLESPWLGPVLQEYLAHRTVPRSAKWIALGFLWPSVGWTATQVVPVPAVSAALLLLALAVSWYLLWLPTR